MESSLHEKGCFGAVVVGAGSGCKIHYLGEMLSWHGDQCDSRCFYLKFVEQNHDNISCALLAFCITDSVASCVSYSLLRHEHFLTVRSEKMQG